MTAALAAAEQPGEFRVYAIRYATRNGVRGQHFHGWDGREAEPHPTSYFVWLARSATSTVLIDAGMSPRRSAPVPEIDYRGSPPELLDELGVAPGEVDFVVLTHLHYDHTGTAFDFPNASILIQQKELDYWTGPDAARNTREAWLSDPEDVAEVERRTRDGRATAIDGDSEIVPGLSVHLVGGHTAGMQVVRIATSKGAVVIASDASHYFENIEGDRPFAILHDVPGMFHAFDRITELADGSGHVIPGHDPAVFDRYPALDGQPGRVAVIA